MDLPQYDQYSKWFGDGPMAVHYGMNQMDLAKQFQDQELQQKTANVKKTTLENLFNEQNNPQLIEHQGLVNRGLGVDTRIKEQTEPYALDAKQKEFIKSAKQSDLDMMELQGQQWAYSPDPQLRAQGEEILRMHKDFIKMRDQGKIQEESQKRLFEHQSRLQAQREAAAEARANARIVAASRKASDEVTSVWRNVQTGKTSPANAAAAFGAAALQARAEGRLEEFRIYSNAAAKMEQLANTTKPDPRAGKSELTPEGVKPAPERAPAFSPTEETPPKRKPLGEY